MTTTDSRAAVLKGLNELVAFLAANPDVPVPTFPTISYFVWGSDTKIRTEVDRVAALIGTEVDLRDAECYQTYLDFGPVRYKAMGLLASAFNRDERGETP